MVVPSVRRDPARHAAPRPWTQPLTRCSVRTTAHARLLWLASVPPPLLPSHVSLSPPPPPVPRLPRLPDCSTREPDEQDELSALFELCAQRGFPTAVAYVGAAVCPASSACPLRPRPGFGVCVCASCAERPCCARGMRRDRRLFLPPTTTTSCRLFAARYHCVCGVGGGWGWGVSRPCTRRPRSLPHARKPQEAGWAMQGVGGVHVCVFAWCPGGLLSSAGL